MGKKKIGAFTDGIAAITNSINIETEYAIAIQTDPDEAYIKRLKAAIRVLKELEKAEFADWNGQCLRLTTWHNERIAKAILAARKLVPGKAVSK